MSLRKAAGENGRHHLYLFVDPCYMPEVGKEMTADILKRAIFYIGTGYGNRFFNHLERAKAAYFTKAPMTLDERRLVSIWKRRKSVCAIYCCGGSSKERISKLKAALLNTIGVRGLPDKYSEEEKERIREQGPFLLERIAGAIRANDIFSDTVMHIGLSDVRSTWKRTKATDDKRKEQKKKSRRIGRK